MYNTLNLYKLFWDYVVCFSCSFVCFGCVVYNIFCGLQFVYPCTCCELAWINCAVCYLEILLGYSCICEMILFYDCYYIFCIFFSFAVLNLRMTKVWCRNVIMNFNYSIQALCIFMSRIIYKRLDANHKLIFRKFEKDLKDYYYLLKKGARRGESSLGK